MKSSIRKLQKYFKLEAERDYDNKAVMGGLANILTSWETEARGDGLPETLIQAVITRLKDYHHLSKNSRKVALQGLWRRIKRTIDIPQDSEVPPPPPTSPHGEEAPPAPTPGSITATAQPPEPRPQVDLDVPVTDIKGIGPKRSEALERLGITTIRDLLYHFPRRYDDYTQLKTIKQLSYGEVVTVIGTVKNVTVRPTRQGNMKIVEAIITDKSGALRVTWFNQPWLAKQLRKAGQIVLSGEVDQYLGRLTMNSPEWEPLEKKNLHTNRIVPVYALTEGLSAKWLRGIMHKAVKKLAPQIADFLPENIRQHADLIPLSRALAQIHFPETHENLQQAQHRLAFNELFILQLSVMAQKQKWQHRTGRTFPSEDAWLEEQLEQLPFDLTGAQQRVLEEVRSDLTSGHPMNRLLQGDVGSGKTIVAALAMDIILHSGSQAALMAPTSILAEQHYHSLRDFFLSPNSDLTEDNIRLLIGDTPETEKETIRAGLETGTVKIVVGTHALLEDPVQFADLQLAVIDEQHRFGVRQRARLREKGDNPHLMVMTATPIPRSLALTVYGDLDISVIDEMPPGRKPVETKIMLPWEREKAYTFVRSELDQGHQAFVITPLVEESENSADKSAVEEHQRLQKEVFPEYQIGLMHGRLSGDEKEAAMTRFRDGDYQILVSTSVVEVGVDVPQATVMLIEGAHRFGLAQLHQLRGRVGRGKEEAYCFLIPGSSEQEENERLQAMENTTDGFVLAELDLQQRGPGQFLGTRQSGFADLQLATISNVKLIKKVRQYARAIFEQDPQLSNPAYAPLADLIAENLQDEASGDIS
jgi:ATP-dependent DNA helicase RecG